MRALRLLGVAAEAEGLRWRREAAAMGRGLAFVAVALVFGIALLVMLHVAGWLWLTREGDAVQAALWLAAADALLLLLLLLLARRRHDPAADAAAHLRDRALAEARHAPLLPDALRGFGLSGGAIAEGVVRALVRR